MMLDEEHSTLGRRKHRKQEKIKKKDKYAGNM